MSQTHSQQFGGLVGVSYEEVWWPGGRLIRISWYVFLVVLNDVVCFRMLIVVFSFIAHA